MNDKSSNNDGMDGEDFYPKEEPGFVQREPPENLDKIFNRVYKDSIKLHVSIHGSLYDKMILFLKNHLILSIGVPISILVFSGILLFMQQDELVPPLHVRDSGKPVRPASANDSSGVNPEKDVSNSHLSLTIEGRDSVCERELVRYSLDNPGNQDITWNVEGGKLQSSDSNQCYIYWSRAGQGLLTVENNDIILAQFVVNVNSLPRITFNPIRPLFVDEGSFPLDFCNPVGGKYVMNDTAIQIINPSILGEGIYQVTYSYNNQNCISDTTFNVFVYRVNIIESFSFQISNENEIDTVMTKIREILSNNEVEIITDSLDIIETKWYIVSSGQRILSKVFVRIVDNKITVGHTDFIFDDSFRSFYSEKDLGTSLNNIEDSLKELLQ